MKILFISLYDITASHVKGIRKKIESQVKYFNKNCENVDWIYRNCDGNIMCNNNKLYSGSRANKELLSITSDFIKLKKKIDVKKYDVIYIRYIIGSLGLLEFVKHANRNNVKVLLEIPTYPYIDEIHRDIQGKIKIAIDNYITNRLKRYIYRIISTNKDNEIFGINTIQIDNGVDLEIVKCINKKENKNKEYLNAIAVASICKWHGYDRFINSMKKYKEKNELKVTFYLVGDGRKEDIEYLKNLVISNDLSEFVIFTGTKEGEELDKLYEKMDFAVSSLALFRAGGGHNPIKTKEYIAKGLPVVTGYEDSLVPSTLEYIYKVDENESIFDLGNIIDWYIKGDFNSKQIRKYALDNVSWDSQIKKIINEIEKDKV